MKLERKAYETRREKGIDFFAGFFGWYGMNVIVIIIGSTIGSMVGGVADPDVILTVAGVIIGALNLVAIVLLALTRTWIALGALTAAGVAFAVVLVIAALIRAACSGIY
jgi:hypothetical protein